MQMKTYYENTHTVFTKHKHNEHEPLHASKVNKTSACCASVRLYIIFVDRPRPRMDICRIQTEVISKSWQMEEERI